MPSKVIVKKTKGKRVQIALSFAFNADDRQAERIYRGVGMCLKETFTPEEGREFLKKFKAAAQAAS